MQDLNDKITGNSLTALEWNEMPTEIQNIIEALGQTLSAGDLNQLGKAIAGYVANGDFYTDSGAANAYVLNVVGGKQVAPAYTDGFKIRYVAGNSTTGASTVNVAGIGLKTQKLDTGADTGENDIRAGDLVEGYYDLASGFFIVRPSPLQQLRTDTSTHDMASDADYSLTAAQNDSGRIVITDTSVFLTAARNIIVLNTQRLFLAQNDTLQALTFKTSAGTGVAVAAGKPKVLLCDAVNVIDPNSEALVGVALQTQRTDDGAVATGTTQFPFNDNIPQNTDGDQYITVTITPQSADSILEIEAQIVVASSVASTLMSAALFKDSVASALVASIGPRNSSINAPVIIPISYEVVAGTTSAITFKVRSGLAAAGTTTFNGSASARIYGGVMNSFIKVTEVSQ